ncbi:arad-like aldolase/epimerase [Suillus ampliporus]|nr:arad-like aldolase/epimerase [Suillus ampliporus]
MIAAPGDASRNPDINKRTDLPVPPTFSDAFEHRAFLKFRLAQAYRIFAKYGYDEGAAGHITVRDPVRPDCYWVNPWGVHFKLMQPDLLLLVDHEGNIQDKESGPNRFLNRTAYMIHSGIHEARPDAVCAAHSHTPYAKAFGTLGVPLDPITQDSCAFYEDHVLCDFRGLVDYREEAGAIVTALGSKKNHGLLVASGSIESTVYFFMSFEKCCQVQIIADQAAAARGQRPRTIGHARAALTQKPLGSEIFELLEHEEGNRFEYTPADKAKL